MNIYILTNSDKINIGKEENVVLKQNILLSIFIRNIVKTKERKKNGS